MGERVTCTACAAPRRHAASFTHTEQLGPTAAFIDQLVPRRGYSGGDAACAGSTTLLHRAPKPNPARSPPAPAMPAGLMSQQSATCSAAAAPGRLQGAGRALPRRHVLSGAAVGRPAPAGLGRGLTTPSRAQGRRAGAMRVQAAATPQVPGANSASEGAFDWLTDEWKEADRKNLRTVSLACFTGLFSCAFMLRHMPAAGAAWDPLQAGRTRVPTRPTTLPAVAATTTPAAAPAARRLIFGCPQPSCPTALLPAGI